MFKHISCLPITLIRNRGQEKKSMRGISSFAEVKLKLSTNAACCEGFSYFFFFFFLIWVLRPFQEYFTYIEPIVHRRWAKTGVPGEKPPDHP